MKFTIVLAVMLLALMTMSLAVSATPQYEENESLFWRRPKPKSKYKILRGNIVRKYSKQISNARKIRNQKLGDLKGEKRDELRKERKSYQSILSKVNRDYNREKRYINRYNRNRNTRNRLRKQLYKKFKKIREDLMMSHGDEKRKILFHFNKLIAKVKGAFNDRVASINRARAKALKAIQHLNPKPKASKKLNTKTGKARLYQRQFGRQKQDIEFKYAQQMEKLNTKKYKAFKNAKKIYNKKKNAAGRAYNIARRKLRRKYRSYRSRRSHEKRLRKKNKAVLAVLKSQYQVIQGKINARFNGFALKYANQKNKALAKALKAFNKKMARL